MSAAGYRWRQLSQKQQEEYWNGARRAGIRGIHLRTGPTLGICDFSFPELVMNTVITLVTV